MLNKINTFLFSFHQFFFYHMLLSPRKTHWLILHNDWPPPPKPADLNNRAITHIAITIAYSLVCSVNMYVHYICMKELMHMRIFAWMYIQQVFISWGIVCSVYTVETMRLSKSACVCVCGGGELQLAGRIGQYLLNRNQTVWIMPCPQKDLLGRIVQHICIY